MDIAPTTTRAVVFDGPAPDASTTRVAVVDRPGPGPGEVSINVEHAGVNFIDVMARRGDQGYVKAWPFVPGFEVAGTVRALGPGVATLSAGERVVALTRAGGLAEVAVAKASLVVRVPGGLALQAAAAAPGALTTAALLLDHAGRLRRGEVVLVHSAGGGVGQALVQLARLAGAGPVLGTVGGAERVAAAERAGYDTVLVRGPGLAGEIRQRTAGRGVDLVLDPQGTALLDVDLEVAAPGARIVVFGNATGEALAPLPSVGQLIGANVSVGGFSLSRLAETAPARVAEAMRSVLDHLAEGRLDVAVTEVDGLDSVAEAQQALAEGRGRGKYIVRVGGANR